MNATHERELVQEFVEAKNSVDLINAQLKTAKTALENANRAILEHLENNDMTATGTHEGLGRVQSNKPRLYASVTKENFDEAKKFLLEIGRDDLVTENINSQSLSSFISKRIEEGEPVPESIGYYLKPQLKVY